MKKNTPFVLLGMLLLLSACTVLNTPQRIVSEVLPAKHGATIDPTELQGDVQRFADDYSAQTVAAVDECARLLGTEEARERGLEWKVAVTTAVIGIACGPQPMANLLDMVALATLNRAAIEDHCSRVTNGFAWRPLLETSRGLETNAWRLADRRLTPAQVAELRDAIVEWQAQNPGARNLFAARPQEFAGMVRSGHHKDGGVGSVFSLVGLDPVAGLDPAVREVALSRLFAERALYTLHRMPLLLRSQTEVLAHRLSRQAGAQTVLTNVDRVGQSAERLSAAVESLSQTASLLPDRIAAERSAILAAFEQQEGKLRELASELNRALVSADRMSGSLTITITNFTALMERFGVGESMTNATPNPDARPFDILDYARTAEQIGEMARDLNALLAGVHQSLPQLERLTQQAGADADRVVGKAFRLGLVLVVVLLIGSVLAALTFRVLAKRLG